MLNTDDVIWISSKDGTRNDVKRDSNIIINQELIKSRTKNIINNEDTSVIVEIEKPS